MLSRVLFWLGIPVALAYSLVLTGCAGTATVLPAIGQGIQGAANYPVQEAQGVMQQCIMSIATLKQEMTGAPPVP